MLAFPTPMRAILPLSALSAVLIIAPAVAQDGEDRDEAGPEEREPAPEPLPVFPERPPGALDSSPEGIAREIAALGADDPEKRRDAVVRLFWIGEPARASAAEASRATDPELASGAARVLNLLDALKALVPLESKKPGGANPVVGSEIEDEEAPGGFYKSPNVPADIPKGLRVPEGKVAILVDSDTPVAFAPKTRGMTVRIVNTTGEPAALDAVDSRLYAVQQALDASGDWRDIETMPGSS
jgi:hypothetical protein